jgi:signal transduction histidine kinase/CheY-like chemotaxis protein/HPt (histidine-containing phosphotransfer) domain-containing protein
VSGPDDVARLERQLAREKAARKRAETLLEEQSRRLYESNRSLEGASIRLNEQVIQRTIALQAAHDQAQRQAEFMATVLDAISEGITVFDSDMRLQIWNANLADMLSIPQTQLQAGKPVTELLALFAERGDYGPGDPDAHVAERLTNLREFSGEEPFREQRRRADGRYIALSGRRLANGGIVTTYSDISEQKQTERTLKSQSDELGRQVEELQNLRRSLEEARDLAQSANRAKSRFIAMISHDIRTPVNGLLGTLTLLQETILSDEQRELLSLALASGEQLRGLLADLIDLSQADAGAIRLEVSALALRPWIETTAAPWRAAAAAKGLAFSVDVAEALPATVLGDAGRLRQILENLLSNAVKYCEEGAIAMHVAAVDDGIAFSVRDTGYGIAPNEQERLFEDFTRLDRTASLSRGFGLGLAITRHLVELMDGRISLTSAVGAGSTFTVWVPLPPAPNDLTQPAIAEWSERRLHTADGRRPRILIAEDVPTNQLIAKSYLEKMGGSVELAANGAEAVDAVRSRPFDLVLMDVDMPVLDGFSATEQIRSLPGAESATPVVVATAYADGDTRMRCAALGVEGFVEKPIQPAWLGYLVQRVLISQHGAISAPDAAPPAGMDLAVLGEMLDGVGPDAGRRLIEMALRDLDTTLQAVEHGVERASIARAAHKLKSLGPTFGAMALGELAGALNVACRSDAPDDERIEGMREEVAREGRRARATIQQYLEELTSAVAFS